MKKETPEDNQQEFEEIMKLINKEIPGELSRGRIYLTHFTDVALSLMRQTADTEKKEFHIEYIDMNRKRDVTFPIKKEYNPQKPLFHNHNFFELMIVCAGTLKVEFEGLEYEYHKGDACIVNREILHEESGTGSYQAVFISMLPEYLNSQVVNGGFVSKRQAGNLFSKFFANNMKDELTRKKDYMEFFCQQEKQGWKQVQELLEALQYEMSHRKAGYDHMVCGILLRLFHVLSNPEFYRFKYIDLGVAKEKDILKEVREYIDHKKAHVTGDELEEKMNFSKNYISRIFKKYMGQTVLQYNRKVCLAEAERMLTDTQLPISEIARRVGYENRTHFYRLFQEQYGVSPNVYRQGMMSHNKTIISSDNNKQ